MWSYLATLTVPALPLSHTVTAGLFFWQSPSHYCTDCYYITVTAPCLAMSLPHVWQCHCLTLALALSHSVTVRRLRPRGTKPAPHRTVPWPRRAVPGCTGGCNCGLRLAAGGVAKKHPPNCLRETCAVSQVVLVPPPPTPHPHPLHSSLNPEDILRPPPGRWIVSRDDTLRSAEYRCEDVIKRELGV